ncbi:MAG: GNAT family N-acetyltransferase [Chloroflexota bacterium]|nr:GNAT family N-acetyltransferase [Chloroflexota bacterium]
MLAETANKDAVQVAGSPEIAGLSFRHFRNMDDIPAMVAVLEGSKLADGMEEVSSVEDMTEVYSNLKNSDPTLDAVLVEVNGRLVGYNRVWWSDESDGRRLYAHVGFILPEWRSRGLGTAMIRHAEWRLREIAAQHTHTGARFFDAWTQDKPELNNFFEAMGYQAVRHGYNMVRPDLENIPELPMPEGLEVRPVQPEHMRTIWEAEVEAFRDHWGSEEVEEADFERWQKWRNFQPHLWMIAWEDNQVAGIIRNFVDEDENARFNRKRGYTENISVRRPWRKRGLARALLARSFQLHKSLGMQEVALGVDTQNPNGALHLYQSMGFQTVSSGTEYRKALG